MTRLTLLIDLMNTVLVPRAGSRYALYSQLLASRGIEADAARVRAAFTAARRAIEPAETHGQDTSPASERRVWTRINAAMVAALSPQDDGDAAAIGAWLFEQLMGNPDLYMVPESMGVFLHEVRALGFQVIGASNQETALVRRLASALRLDSLLDMLITSDEVGYAKPDVRFFAAVLSASGATKDRAAFMGNNPVNDMAGAAAAGIPLRFLVDYEGQFGDDPAYMRVTDPRAALPSLVAFAAA